MLRSVQARTVQSHFLLHSGDGFAEWVDMQVLYQKSGKWDFQAIGGSHGQTELLTLGSVVTQKNCKQRWRLVVTQAVSIFYPGACCHTEQNPALRANQGAVHPLGKQSRKSCGRS